jgi:hypothetical protein
LTPSHAYPIIQSKYVQEHIFNTDIPSHTLARHYRSSMPYPAAHRREVRKKIIESARRLFNRHGFDKYRCNRLWPAPASPTVAFTATSEAKRTFTPMFWAAFFTDPNWKSCWEGVEVDLTSTDVGPQVVRAYLSRQHYEDVENSCRWLHCPVMSPAATRRPNMFFKLYPSYGQCAGA